MVPSRRGLHFALLALSGCIAVTTAHFGHFDPDCPEDEQPPTSVKYLDAGLAIALDAGHFTNCSVSLQYTNNKAALNWQATIGTEIGTNIQVQVIVKKKNAKQVFETVYDSGRTSFCKSVPKVRSYIDVLLGFDLASPPVIACPYAPGPYELNAYHPDPSRLLDSNIPKGQLAVSYEFTINGIMQIRYTVDVIVS